MQKNLASQRGVSMLGLLMTFVVLACVLTIGLKVIPAYVDHNFVSSMAESMVERGEAGNMTQEEVRREIANSLRINNIHDFDMSSITLSRQQGAPRINIRYERRIHLFYNIDVVLSFDESHS